MAFDRHWNVFASLVYQLLSWVFANTLWPSSGRATVGRLSGLLLGYLPSSHLGGPFGVTAGFR